MFIRHISCANVCRLRRCPGDCHHSDHAAVCMSVPAIAPLLPPGGIPRWVSLQALCQDERYMCTVNRSNTGLSQTCTNTYAFMKVTNLSVHVPWSFGPGLYWIRWSKRFIYLPQIFDCVSNITVWKCIPKKNCIYESLFVKYTITSYSSRMNVKAVALGTMHMVLVY